MRINEQSNRPKPPVSLSQLTGRYGTDDDNVFFQPCSRNPNGCNKLGSPCGGAVKEYLCKLTPQKQVICGQSALVE